LQILLTAAAPYDSTFLNLFKILFMKKKFIQSAVAIQLLLLLTTGAAAQSINTDKPATEMKIAGQINNQPVFELFINNDAYSRYKVIVTDEYGTLMHEETLNGTNPSRKFMINKTELGETGVVFEVYSGGIKTATYTIKNNRIITDNFIVTVKK
jgi:hypothetical protein